MKFMKFKLLILLMFLIFSCDRENEKLEIIIQEYQNHEAYD